MVTVPEAIDGSITDNFLTKLDDYAKTVFHYGSKSSFVLNMGVSFDYSLATVPNQFAFELRSDCRRAAFAANVPEKDSVRISEYACSMYTGEDDYYTYMTQQQWQERMSGLIADAWLATTGCGGRLGISGSEKASAREGEWCLLQ